MFKKSLLKIFCFTGSYINLISLEAQIYNDTYCEFNCCDPCYACQNQFWLEADYLYWKIQDTSEIIPLVIEQPLIDGPFNVVLGGKEIKDDWHSGAKITFGGWFDQCRNFGAEVNYFFLPKNSNQFSVASDAEGSPRLRIPYFNVTTGLPDSSALATPGVFRGTALLETSDKMQGAELNIVEEIPSKNLASFKIVTGFRYWNFEDRLTFSVTSPLVVTPTVYNYKDKFSTQNNFFGGQIGSYLTQNFSSFSFKIKAKIALGAMYQSSTIKGRFQTNEFTGSIESFNGGFFALPSNIGHHSTRCFSVIPELNFNIAYHFTDYFYVHLGYSGIYANEVLRANKQMSSDLNPTQSANIEFTPTPVLIGEAIPNSKLKSSNLWIHGLNFGLDFAF